jgi:hypothetical protein
MSAFDSLEDALSVYGIPADLFLQELLQAASAQGGTETSYPGESEKRE